MWRTSGGGNRTWIFNHYFSSIQLVIFGANQSRDQIRVTWLGVANDMLECTCFDWALFCISAFAVAHLKRENRNCRAHNTTQRQITWSNSILPGRMLNLKKLWKIQKIIQRVSWMWTISKIAFFRRVRLSEGYYSPTE